MFVVSVFASLDNFRVFFLPSQGVLPGSPVAIKWNTETDIRTHLMFVLSPNALPKRQFRQLINTSLLQVAAAVIVCTGRAENAQTQRYCAHRAHTLRHPHGVRVAFPCFDVSCVRVLVCVCHVDTGSHTACTQLLRSASRRSRRPVRNGKTCIQTSGRLCAACRMFQSVNNLM